MSELWSRFWKDKHGKVVLWQNPNIPLLVWFVCTVAGKLFSTGQPKLFFSTIAFGALFTWAYLEITKGVDYFRRALGVVVLLLTIWSRLKS